ncbi:uncharacterized protein G2W53_009586 [Senna tora]|uniref:Uncharacterized protein n=1 Tax=Senna tora TaxID=362788 RepID=A0A834WYA1_9FABA|nr:uncharacterized protein G2W53_009586 [Senna tora]
MLRLESSWHGRSVDHVLTYFGRQIAVGSQKTSRITRQKTCCASESNTSVRVVFANQSGFDAPIGVVLAWVERGSCLNIFRTTNHGRISETFMNYDAKDLLRNVDHVLTYSGRQIAVGSQKPSRITRQKTCCATDKSRSDLRNLHELRGKRLVAQVSQTRRFMNQSGFDAPIVVVLAWEERGSCLNIFRTKNRRRISETFTNYEAKDLLRKSRLGMGGAWIMSQRIPDDKLRLNLRNLHELRGKRLVDQVSQTSRFANGSGFDAPIGVVLAWEERGSCLNICRTRNHGRISETFTNYEAKDLLRKNLHKLRGKRLVAQVSPTIRFVNRSGFDAPIGIVLAWEERGSCLNIFRTKNRSRISETFTNYEAKDLLRKNLHELRGKRVVAQVSQTRRFVNQSGFDAPIGVVSAWEERGSCLNKFRMTNHGRVSETLTNDEAKDSLRKNLHELRGKRLVAQVRQTRRFANGSGFDAPIGVVSAWEERGSCLNIFQTTNHGRISETFTNYEAKDLLRKSVDHVSTHSRRETAIGSRKTSRISRQKPCWASESNTLVRVVFANRSGFDAPIGIVLACEKRGSCLNIYRTTNRGRISETFTNYEAKDFVDHDLTYSGRQIVVGSQKPSRITRQKTCCASESNTSVHVVFGNESGFDAPIGVVSAWEERGSCLNIFRTTNCGRISETFTNYEAKDLLRK